MEKNLWLIYVILAGLAWGTYVPIIFYGGGELGGKSLSRMLAILCVGGVKSGWRRAFAGRRHHSRTSSPRW